MSEWNHTILKDCLVKIIDNRGKTPKNITNVGHPLLEVNSISLDSRTPKYSDVRKYVNEKTFNEWFRSGHPQIGDILIPTVGTLGAVSLIDRNDCCIAQNLVAIRTNDEICNSSFLYYYLKNNKVRRQLLKLDIGGVQPSIKVPHLLQLKISIPPIFIQNRIASILSSLDDKIAVNRRICENLEAQAQALFKHWFIDFAPFLDKPSGKAERKNGNFCANREQNETCFNSAEVQPKITGKACKFVESELGMIPEGWRVGTLGDIAEVNPSRILKKGVTATYLDMKNMPTSGSFPINWENKEFVGGMKFKNGDTLMARITPCLENGKVAYANFLRDGEIAFGSTEYIVMTAKESIFPEFLYTLCRFPSFVNYAVKNMNGSSGRQRVSGETISNYRMVIAPESVYSSVRPIFQEYMLQIRECGFENLRLSTLRDTLLPKLMSGQIKV